MRDLILNFLNILYSYYKSGKYNNDAYPKAISVFIAITGFNGWVLLMILNVYKYLDFFVIRGNKMVLAGIFLIFYYIPVYYLIKRNFSKEEVEKALSDDGDCKKWKSIVVIYCILTLLLFIISVFFFNPKSNHCLEFWRW